MGKMFLTICLFLCLVDSSLSFADWGSPMSSEEKQKEVLRLVKLSTDDLIAEIENTASKAKLSLHKTRIDILISLMAQELSKRGERKSLIILYKICDEGKTHAVVHAALSVCRIEIKDKDISEKVKILEKLLIHEKTCFQSASAQILKELNSEKALVILKKYAKTNGFAKKSMLESEVNSLSDKESAKRLLEVLKTDVVEGNMTHTIAYNILIDMGRKGKKISSPMLTTLNSLKDLNISKENKEKLTDLIVNGIYLVGDKEVIKRLTEDQKKYWYKQEERRKKLRKEIIGQKKDKNKEPGSEWLVLCLVVAGLVIAGLVVFLLLRRKK